ncbi:hypothetical protein B0H21DRAFT_583960 [Amylocystis lapponica]|nr:hypothetical protein B0H21DRAFT_583960 [Amylocystis lapponica]
MASKRKYAEIDSDDDEPLLGRQVLPVANLPDNFNGDPSDGLQYLFTVRRDARLLPHVVRAPENPYEVKEEPKVDPELGPGVSHPDLPSEKWREMFLTRFRNFRKNCVQPTVSVHNPHAGSSRKVLPDRKDRDAWWAFLAGRPQAEWDPPKKPKQPRQDRSARWRNDRYGSGPRGYSEVRDDPRPSYDYQEQDSAYHESIQETWHVNEEGEVELSTSDDPTRSLPTPSGTPAPQGRETRLTEGEGSTPTVLPSTSSITCVPREPTPSLMQHIDHRYALHLLMYLTHWMNLHLEPSHSASWRITDVHARWIFVLLSRVEDHISADDMNQLRNLARACIAFIGLDRAPPASVEEAGKEDGHMKVLSCWLAITAVAGFWGQRDLWEDAEAMLTKLEKTSC